MNNIIELIKEYEEFKFRTVKKAGPKLTRGDLERHLKEQEDYENKTFYCNICKCHEKIKDVNKHIHRRLDKYDQEYIYGSSDSD